MRHKLKKLPDYKKPPVNEVACGILFEKITNFRGHHPGLFWRKIKKQFPACEHALRTGGLNPEHLNLADYLPRMWFVNEEQNKLVQLQDDCLFFNWRRRQQDEEYPHYSTIIKSFKANFNKFEKFLEEENMGPIAPRECELTYVNVIQKGEGWESFSDRIFRDFIWDASKSRFLSAPVALGWQAFFPLPDNKGHLNVTLQTKERAVDKKPILALQITARGLGADKSIDAAWEWFHIAHEWIVRGFTDLTDETIHNIWQRIQ